MSLQLQYLHCRLIKVYNIKSGTKVNFVIYVLTWAPEIMQAHHCFSTLEKYMSGERRGESKRSLGWECTPPIRALLLLEGEKQMMNPLWLVLPGTFGKKKSGGGERRWGEEIKISVLHLGCVLYGLCSLLEDRTLKTFFTTAYMKITTKLCSRDRWSYLFS